MTTPASHGDALTGTPTQIAANTKPFAGPDAVKVGAVVIGFFVIGPLARWNPVVVNSFLLLVLLSSLLLTRDRWLPLITPKGKA